MDIVREQMKPKYFICIFALLLLAVCLLTGCKKSDPYEGKTKVVFELEGGKYQNTANPITHYYAPADEGSLKITEPRELSGEEISRVGYTLVGWYRTKTVTESGTVYSDEWNFDSDLVGNDGITLYAKWEKNLRYSFDVYYESGEGLTLLKSTKVKENAKFDTNFAKRSGYTAIAYFDENGERIDLSTFRHPGGTTDVAVKVIVQYLEGEYAAIANASDLRKALNAGNKNIYLLSDIDFEGGELNATAVNNGELVPFTQIIEGNGYKIYNFKIGYGVTRTDLVTDSAVHSARNMTAVSIFGALDGATLRNITFEDFTVDIRTTSSLTGAIVFAPLALKANNTTLENVTVSGSVTVSAAPANMESDNIVLCTDSAVLAETGTTQTNVSVAVQTDE